MYHTLVKMHLVGGRKTASRNFGNKLCYFSDNIIKIWRLFPFAEEALAPLMTLYFDELPRHLCVAHHRLLVALYERSRANYAVTVYKTTQKGTCIIDIKNIGFSQQRNYHWCITPPPSRKKLHLVYYPPPPPSIVGHYKTP